MLTSAPWLTANNPLDFMRAGTGAGLQHLSISNAAAEAGDRIKLGFAELNQRAADAAANRAQEASNAAASLRASVSENTIQNMFRARALDQSQANQQTDNERAAQALELERQKYAQTQLTPLSAEGKLARDINVASKAGNTDAANQLRSVMDFKAGKAEAPLSNIAKLQSDREKAFQRGDDNAVRQLDAAIEEQTSNKGQSVYMGLDDNGKPIFQMTTGGSKPIGSVGTSTVATQTKAQGNLLKYENSMELLNNLEKKLRPEHVGMAGSAGELILDKTLPQFGIGTSDTNRIQARSALVTTRESLMRIISDDPRFSAKDREAISAALPSTGVFESYPDAMARIKEVRRLLSSRGRVYSRALGIPDPTWTFDEANDVRDAYQSGKISQEQAIDALKRFH